MVRLPVARQKVLQARHVAECGRSNQHRTTGAALDQADPAQDQRAHDALAEVGFGNEKRAQFVRRNQQRLDIALGMAVDQRDAPRKLADLGQELPRPLIEQRRDMAEPVAERDRDMSRQHHEHAGTGLAGLKQRLAIPKAARFCRTGACARFHVASMRGMSARGAGTRNAGGPVSCLCSHLATQKTLCARQPARARNFPAYRRGSSSTESSREASAVSEDGAASSLRPRACDFRRLRFSRSASFSRAARNPSPPSSCACRVSASREHIVFASHALRNRRLSCKARPETVDPLKCDQTKMIEFEA